jgi:hypothetical protein
VPRSKEIASRPSFPNNRLLDTRTDEIADTDFGQRTAAQLESLSSVLILRRNDLDLQLGPC